MNCDISEEAPPCGAKAEHKSVELGWEVEDEAVVVVENTESLVVNLAIDREDTQRRGGTNVWRILAYGGRTWCFPRWLYGTIYVQERSVDLVA